MVITVTPRMQPYCFQRAFCQSSKISPFCIWHVCFFRWLQRGKSIVTNATYESHNLQKDSFLFIYQTKQQRYLMNDMMCQILHFFFFFWVSVRYSTFYKCITQIQHITDFSTLQSEMITLLCRIASHALKVCELKVETLQGAILRKISFPIEPLWNEQRKRESDI